MTNIPRRNNGRFLVGFDSGNSSLILYALNLEYLLSVRVTQETKLDVELLFSVACTADPSSYSKSVARVMKL